MRSLIQRSVAFWCQAKTFGWSPPLKRGNTIRTQVSAALLGLSMVILAASVSPPPGAQEEREHAFRPPVEPARDADFFHPPAAVIKLGQMLYFDKILGGNRNMSCATCHSPIIATTDGLSINVGSGGQGLGPLRDAGSYPPGPRDPIERGQRNMPPVFNLGHKEFVRLFWDGRISVDPSVPQGFLTVAGSDFPAGFNHLIEAISILAPTEAQEMTGRPPTNELADAAAASPFKGVWHGILVRIRGIEEYRNLFFDAFPELARDPDQISIVHVGKAIGAFQAAFFRSDNSPFDQYLRGDPEAIGKSATEGMKLFYGKAHCVRCHSGTFQTDHQFHAIGVPQIGPGFGGMGNDGREDFGREGVTHDPADRYKFRTPSLRNTALTGPWGHDGFFNTLEGIVRHHLDPVRSLHSANPSQRVLPSRPDLDAIDLIAFNNPVTTAAITSRIELQPQTLSDHQVSDLIAFLLTLTDPSAMDLRKSIPKRVPSGLPLAEIK
jgi:cytochrome c peroxidase